MLNTFSRPWPVLLIGVAVLLLSVSACSEGRRSATNMATSGEHRGTVLSASVEHPWPVAGEGPKAKSQTEQKKVTAAVDAQADKTGSGPQLAFDANSTENTLRWLSTVHRNRKYIPDNELAQAEADQEFRKALDTPKGKEVKWIVTVGYVSSEGILPSPLSLPSKAGEQSVFRNPQGTKAFGSPLLFLNAGRSSLSFKAPQEEWVKKLRRGDKIKLVGVVEGIALGEPDRVPQLWLVRRDLAVPKNSINYVIGVGMYTLSPVN